MSGSATTKSYDLEVKRSSSILFEAGSEIVAGRVAKLIGGNSVMVLAAYPERDLYLFIEQPSDRKYRFDPQTGWLWVRYWSAQAQRFVSVPGVSAFRLGFTFTAVCG